MLVVIINFGDWMNEIFYRASNKHGISYGEFVRDIKKAQSLCGAEQMATDEFVKKITIMALERYLEDNL